jgi:ribosomal protein S18 acetylase RimI-like enzyme
VARVSTIRRPNLSDLPGIYRVCRETGPASVNPDLLGHLYAGPYVVNQPELSRVVAGETGIEGYVLACSDTREFEEWCEAHWWPQLRAQYPVDGGHPLDKWMTRLLHEPPHSPDVVVAAHPVHLHIDLLPSAQGRGLGRELIEWLCEELARRNVAGVHLGMSADNAGAIAFYERLGFETLLVEADTVWMGRLLR